MARTMRAAKLARAGELQSVEIQEVPIPELGREEVLVRVESSPILPADIEYPLGVLGHESSGTVVESGGGALGDSLIGKRVHVFTFRGGAWAEYLVSPASECVLLLDEVTFDQGANLINPLMILEFQEILTKAGHRACLQTAANSSLGKMFIRFCQNHSIPLINIVRSEKSAESLRIRGVQNVLNSSEPGFEVTCKELCRSLNVTVGFDAIYGKMLAKLRDIVGPRVIVYPYGSLSVKEHPETFPADALIVISWAAEKSPEEREALFQTIQRELTSTFQTEIVGHYTLDQVQEAVNNYLSSRSAGKPLIHPNRKLV